MGGVENNVSPTGTSKINYQSPVKTEAHNIKKINKGNEAPGAYLANGQPNSVFFT